MSVFDDFPTVAERYPHGTTYEQLRRTEFILALILACKVDRTNWRARAERAEFLLALALTVRMQPPPEFLEWAAERNAQYAADRSGANPAHKHVLRLQEPGLHSGTG